MNTISSITSSGYAAPPVKHTASIEKIFQGDTDTFIANSEQEEMICVERQGRMAQEQIETLSKQYDLHNMDRNQFSRLLAELRDSGVITPQEYSAAYAGTMPQGMPQKPVFPFGKEKADFVQLMEQCAKCCADLPASPDGEALTSVYTRLNAVFNQIDQSGQADPAGEQSGNTQAVEKNPLREQYSEKVIQLYEQLNPEENRRGLTDASSTTTRELAKELLLSDDKLVESIAKRLWTGRAEANQERIKDGHPEMVLYLPADYTKIADTIRGLLTGKVPDSITLFGIRESGCAPGSTLVYDALDNFLVHKVRSGERLTEVERAVSKDAAWEEAYIWQNFNDRMTGIQDKINSQLGESGFSLDIDKEYQFYLDTATFTFSVKGGSDEENKAIENAINTHPRENYKFDPLRETLMAMYFSRPDNLSITPWRAGVTPNKLLQEYGIASDIPASYSRKMEQFLSAYNWHEMDQNLKYSFGFGADDIHWDGEKLVGKTDEVTKLIEKMDEDMMRATGLAYERLRSKYTETPEFSEPVFVFKDGKFQLTYEKT